MKVLCVFGEHNYGDPSRGTSHEFANFMPALRSLGHEVVHFDCWNKSLYADFAELNRRFLETVQVEDPDVVLCVLMGYEIWVETLALARQGSRARFVHWGTDDSWKYEKFSRFIAPAFDVYATTYASACAKARAEGMDNFVLTQWAANGAAMQPPLPSSQCRYDVSFVGSAYGNRMRWVGDLHERGIDVACFGYGWPNGPVAEDEIPNIIRASRLSLNFGDSGLVVTGGRLDRNRQIKARVFEVPGAGGFLLTEPAEHLEDFYDPEREIACFASLEELCEKIRFYLGHPEVRDRMATAGFARTRAEHSYEARFSRLFEAMPSIRGTDAASGIDMPAFHRLEEMHHAGFLLRFLVTLLVIPFVVIWGKRRGRRAARKALFELCWRVSGRKTYSVSGLPGRLFYHES